MTRMLRAFDVAQWFVAWAENIDAEISNLKVQKLLYYAQGKSLADRGVPLFDDPIEAWAHGPVVAEVYHELKKFGKNPIDPDVILGEDFSWDCFKDVEPILLATWDTYGSLAAWALRERTHRESPWRESFDETRSKTISIKQLEAFFVHGR